MGSIASTGQPLSRRAAPWLWLRPPPRSRIDDGSTLIAPGGGGAGAATKDASTMSGLQRTHDQVIELATAFLKASGITYQKLGCVVYMGHERFDRILAALRKDFTTSDPRRLDPIQRDNFLRELGEIRARQRPHWSVEVVCYPMTDDLNPHVVIYDDSDAPVLE